MSLCSSAESESKSSSGFGVKYSRPLLRILKALDVQSESSNCLKRKNLILSGKHSSEKNKFRSKTTVASFWTKIVLRIFPDNEALYSTFFHNAFVFTCKIQSSIPQPHCVSFHMNKLNNSKKNFNSMILKSCGTSMNAVHESHQIVFTLRCKRNQKKDFTKSQ